jgi:hypothetical protein
MTEFQWKVWKHKLFDSTVNACGLAIFFKFFTSLVLQKSTFLWARSPYGLTRGNSGLGLATEFHSEKIPWNRLWMAFVIRGRKCSFRGTPRFMEVSIPRLETKEHGMKKICFTQNPAPASRIDSMFLSKTIRNGIPRVCFYFVFTERNSEHFSPLRNDSERNSESFLFRGMVQKWIPRVCFYFCSMIQNSKHFSPLRNGSEWNSESFLFRRTARILPEQTNCSVYSVFRGIIFFGNRQPYSG